MTDALTAPTDSGSSVAELIVRCLENEGVTHIFGIPGEENIHLVEALSRRSPGPTVLPHHWAQPAG